MFISFFLLITIFLIKNTSQDDFKCKESDKDREIEIGDEVTLCLHSKERKIKIASKLKVDEYSIVTIEGGYSNLLKEDTQGANSVLRNNEQKPEKNKYIRRMMVEPENNNKEIYNINNPSTNTANKQNPIETTTKTTVVPTPPRAARNSETPAQTPEEEEINPDDKSRIIAQIGDKITQYPSVIIYII